MYTLPKGEAIEFVRARIDELADAENFPSEMLGQAQDDTLMDTLIGKLLPEAIDAVHLQAPVGTLETYETGYDGEYLSDGVLRFSTDKPVLRMVAFRAADSDVMVDSFVAEASPMGRMQLNRYVRGRSDAPVLVMQNGTRDHFRYYTAGDVLVNRPVKVADYLFELNISSLDYAYAKQYFLTRNPQMGIGGCSSARFGNFYGRNLDWFYGEQVDMIMRSAAVPGRHAVMGVAGGMAEFTKALVESGADTELYKILPFYLQDGINDAGLVCNINVVPRDFEEASPSIPLVEKRESICAIMLVRYILDKFSTASEACSYLRDYVEIYMPQALLDMGYEAHFMIADANDTFIIEIVGHEVKIIDDYSWMTNFYVHGMTPGTPGGEMLVFTPEDVAEGWYPTSAPPNGNDQSEHASGLERWNIIAAEFDYDHTKEEMRDLMNRLLFTNAYKNSTDPFWYSEFVSPTTFNVDTPPDDPLVTSAVDTAIAAYERRSRRNPVTWQTTHSCVYDLTEKKVYVVAQEDTEHEHEFGFYDDLAETHIAQLSYITNAVQADSYELSTVLVNPILNYLTGLLLTSWGLADRAQIFYKKATL